MKREVLLLTWILAAVSSLSGMAGRGIIVYGESEGAAADLKEAIEDLWYSDYANPVAAGENHIVAIEQDGDYDFFLTALGNNDFGQLEVPAYYGYDPKAVAAGRNFSVVLYLDGTVAAWGENSLGQTDVPEGLTNVVSIAAGFDHALALKGDGTVTAWGSGLSGPYELPEGLTNISAIAAGEGFSLFLKDDGSVIAHGNNDYGQCDVPESLTEVAAIAAGQRHSIALSNNGEVTAWGDNQYGQLNIPHGVGGITAISAGANHNLALLKSSMIIAWGRNHKGQTDISRKVEGMSEIAAGFDFSMALGWIARRWGKYVNGGFNDVWWIEDCDWLGTIEVANEPWIWSACLKSWIHVPEESAIAEIGWIYVTSALECLPLTEDPSIPWHWSEDLNTLLYVPEKTLSGNSGWVFVY